MRIVICGAGIVGSAIATHLAAEQNDVTVIDHDEEERNVLQNMQTYRQLSVLHLTQMFLRELDLSKLN